VSQVGPGLAAADVESVWRPYQRGRTAGHTAGSGIGLAIVRDVAAQHGGRAWIDSPVSGARGATFVVAFPIPASAPEAAADVERVARPAAPPVG
jgi:signal transduction histidine kinase